MQNVLYILKGSYISEENHSQLSTYKLTLFPAMTRTGDLFLQFEQTAGFRGFCNHHCKQISY